MEKVRIALYTPLPGFANDLCDVLKLFFQVEAFDVNPEGEGGEPLRHDYQERGGVARSVMHLRGRSFSMGAGFAAGRPRRGRRAFGGLRSSGCESACASCRCTVC